MDKPTEGRPNPRREESSVEEDARKVSFASQEDFVRALNGVRVIKRILVANNGIAAVKCMRSIRSWAYATFRNAEAFFFVCMASPEDIQANAEYIKMANKMVMVPGGSNLNNYANVELIFQTAVANHVDAVWAGWGHASENPQLPKILAEHNIALLGPDHDAMWALGDKIASTILAQSAGIPTVPWSGSHIVVNTEDVLSPGSSIAQPPSSRRSVSELISPEDYDRACVSTVEHCQAACNKIGYPVMIKASEGGGGKGIRRATHSTEVAGLFTQVQSEVPESPIFVMKCVEHVRHLEVQLLADQYGEAISLFGRDCSVQRRHQKILEEAPVIVAPQEVFDAMERAAIKLAKLVGYTSAGTVEYLYNTETQEFFFLELNPRLQVEHPCTEVISGVNLPACQLQIAMGIPLVRIKDIRNLFGLGQSENYAVSLSDNLSLRKPPSSHVIAVRVTSEDPDEGFKPRSGDVFELNFKSSRSVWGYFSVGTVGGIHEFADSQFGHCFSAEASREQARENMVLALRELLIRGDFRTTVEYLIKILESDAYIYNEIDTEWLDRLIAQKDRPAKPDICLGVMCTALHIAFRTLEQAYRNFEMLFERGQFFPTNQLSNCVDVTLISEGVKYVLQVVRTGKTSFHLITNGGLQAAEVHRMSGDGLLITHESSSYMTYCREDAQGYQTVIDNRTIVFSKECDLSLLRSPSPGKLVQFTVSDGCHVFENEVYALVEVMKLVLELRSPASGCIFHLRCAGAILESGALIARLQLDDPQQCPALSLFTGQLNPVHSTPSGLYQHDSGPALSLSSGVASVEFSLAAEAGVETAPPPATEAADSASLSTESLEMQLPATADAVSSTFTPNVMDEAGQHHVFHRCFSELEEVLAGYALPEPFFTPWLNRKLDELFQCLRCPRLPLLELEEAVAQLSGRLPVAVEQSLCALTASYADEVTSMLSNFPADKIVRLVEGHIASRRLESTSEPNVTEASITAFQQTIKRLIDLADRYRGGLRGHAARTITNLLLAYLAVEQHYQHGQFDRCVNLLLTRHKAATASGSGSFEGASTSRKAADMLPPISWTLPDSVQRLADPTSVTDVVSVHFSHHQLAAKNVLIVGLIERFTRQRDITPTRDLLDSLTALTQLGMAANSKVALAARKYLISAQSPPYELRRNQVESIILSAINNYNEHFPMENLQRLITCETSVYDVLLDFLYHPNPLVVSAALEVYVRRSYITYELTGVQHFDLPAGVSCIFFKFLLPQASMHLNFWRHYISTLRHPPGESAKTSSTKISSEASMGSEDSKSSELDWFLAGDCANMYQANSEQPGGQENATMFSPSSDATLVSRSHCQRTGSVGGFSDLGTPTPGFRCVSGRERLGSIAVFKSFADFKSSFPSLISRLQQKLKTIDLEKRAGGRRQNSFSSSQTCRAATCGTMPSDSFVSFQDPPFHATSVNDVPMNVLNIALQSTGLTTTVSGSHSSPSLAEDEVNEEADVQLLEEFCQANSQLLQSVGIRRVTFMIVMPRKFPVFFTFRARDNFREDRVYRHLEPALAFQMEINRLRNYNLELIPVLNRRMHIYLGQAKISQGQGAVDFRFFVRSMIRHADLVSKAASFEYLRSEAERTLLEAMDALEVAFTHPKAGFTTGNHIFFNFAPTLLLEDMRQLQLTVRRTIVRYATRLIKLRVSHAELKMVVRLRKNGPRVPIRLFIANEQGYSLKLEVYREVPNLVTGAVHLASYGSHVGRLHGALADMPYETKDFLQLKRFQAQKFNSSYVYDYPALFGQVLRDDWENYRPSTVYFTLENEVGESQAQTSVTAEKSVGTEAPGRPFSDYILECTELCLDGSGQLIPVDRVAGLNKVGIVVWKMVMKTLEFPGGRPVIVIANDVTHKAGSFGPAEDLIFYRASELARRLGIPRVFIAANTGARIRLAEEVKAVFKVAWIDDSNPAKGFRYLYLTESDYTKLDALKSVNCELVEENGEKRYKIIDVIGRDFDISVENLRGSALIAGETAAAYEECFTISVVPSRTIGIGAYLVRLGQRVIQVDNSHIILTGAMALNKLLGREVYTSNSQLGGVQVMANNGVCHSVVPDEYAALQHVIKWLSFVPYERGGRLPILRRPLPPSILSQVSSASSLTLTASSQVEPNSDTDLPAESLALLYDPIDRPVEYLPTRERQNDDPRWMFAGVMSGQLQTPTPSATSTPPGSGTQIAQTNEATTPTPRGAAGNGGGRWLSGFFDWGTWEESLAAWAAGVVVGRARLGGIPCGIICPETRVSISRVPADPANPASEAQTISQAGQVWYPDSSYKTAQAIADFAREGLPLFIFANWRGFSGGLKDMYDQVLKFGAMIVESLRTYTNPVFVYLPPHAELRGGAWVVIDPAINPDNMELFCSPDTCRGGVLEPEGTVEIKYRTADLLATINRLDDECRRLSEEIKARSTGRQQLLQPQQSSGSCNATATTPASSSTLKGLQERLVARQHMLLPIYQQVAHRFADLHDTPGRMTARGLVHGTVDWRSSRAFFFARLSRRLLELEAVRLLRQAQNPLNTPDAVPPAPGDRCSEEIEEEAEAEVRWSHQDKGKVRTRLWSRAVDCRLRTSSDCESPSSRMPLEVLGVPRSELRDLTHSSELNAEPDAVLLSDAERACYLIAQIGAQRSASVRRDLTRLRRWFIQDHLSKETPESCLIFPGATACNETVGDSIAPPVFSLADVQPSASSDLAEAVRAWETSDATVARWLAVQLEHPDLCRLLENFNAPLLVAGCWTLVAASEAETVDVANVSTRQPPKSSLMSRLQEISKQQMVNHIKRLLVSHPECISEALECVQHLQNASVSTAAAPSTTAPPRPVQTACRSTASRPLSESPA
ncbi:hypothetical protein AAHC03_016978 [Spirometra sp. Aus1]